MTPERWQRIKELFRAALEREAGERAAFLDAECAGDAEVRAEVESLVVAPEYVEGETLRERLRRGELPLTEALDIAVQVAAALSATHAAHVIHRDIKPENLIVRNDGYVKVLDFGLAKLARPTRAHAADSNAFDSLGGALVDTSPGVVMGTVSYMSPEQARGYEVDERADVWSLGVVLYEMAAGRQPFTGPTPSDVMASVLQREPPPLSSQLTAIPAELERIALKALAKDC